MKVRFLFILIVVGAGHLHCFAQDYKKTAAQQFMQYTNLIIKKDFRKAADFIMDDFYTLIPREQLIKAMETIFNMPEFDYQIDSAKVVKVGDARLIDSAHFLKLQYSNILLMKFGSDSTLSDAAGAENEFLTLTLQSKFGEPNVKYNKASRYYSILSIKDVIARSENLTDWKFIVMEEDKIPFLKKIIPKELLE